LTTGRFCAQCGKEPGGGAFCQHCGTSQAIVAAPATATPEPTPSEPALNAFCPSCGTKAEPGLAFCTKCGANLETGLPLAPSQHLRPSGAQSQTPLYIGAGAVVVALIIAVVVMSGGNDDGSLGNASQASAPSAASPAAGASPAQQATPAPSRTTPAPPSPVGPPIPALTAAGGSIGSVDGQTTTAVETALRQGGYDLTGVLVLVEYMRGTGDQQALILDVDAKKATTLSGKLGTEAELRKFLAALTSSPLVRRSKVTRVIVNVKDTDPQQGPYTLTMVMSLDTAEGIAKGTVTQAQMQSQVQIRTRKG
jgi:hypothetical protein